MDVGSCWDYFRRHDDAFEVIAQDLRPRKGAVLRSDFLELVIADDAAAAPGIHPARSTPGGGPHYSLTSLPRGCATAVVMSLVLSYVPTPKLRGEVRPIQKRFTRPSVSTFDRVSFQLTDGHFFVWPGPQHPDAFWVDFGDFELRFG